MKIISGFTLLEVIAVIVIMGIFFAVSIPLFSRFLENARLDTCTRSVASVLRLARSYAITGDVDCYVVFDTGVSPNEYYDSYNAADPVEKKYKLPAGIWFYRPGDPNPTEEAVTFNNDIACFKPTGELDEADNRSVYIADGQSDDARSKIITVERTTGNLEIE